MVQKKNPRNQKYIFLEPIEIMCQRHTRTWNWTPQIYFNNKCIKGNNGISPQILDEDTFFMVLCTLKTIAS
jgi:hypothetical protein